MIPKASPGGASQAAASAANVPEYIEKVERLGELISLPPATVVKYGAAAGQQFAVYAPPRDDVSPDARPLPVAVFFHGGSWIRGDLSWLRFMAPAVTALPAIFVAGTYRLAPENRWPSPYEDVRDTIRHVHRVVRNYGGDPQRMIVAGHSAGGHLAAMAVLRREIPKLLGCLPVSSPFDLRYGAVADDSDEGRAYKYLLQRREDDADASPVLFTEGNETPFHVTWGSNDFPRIARSSQGFVASLRGSGSHVTHDVIDGAGHFDTHLMLADPRSRWYTRAREILRPTSAYAL